MLNSPKPMRDISSMDYVSMVAFLCPNLKEVYLGYKQVCNSFRGVCTLLSDDIALVFHRDLG